MADSDFDREAARVAERAERAGVQARERLDRAGRISGEAATGDGAITVEVGPGGLLTDVRLTNAALRSGSEVVAAQIMELSRTATRRAGDRMYRVLAPMLGPGGERQLTALGYEPISEDDDDEPPATGLGGR